MRALVFANNQLTLDPKRPDPPERDGDTLIRVRTAGVCATDLEITKGYMNFSGVLGHEFVGVVEASPDKSLVGKRVCGEINCACSRCDLCLSGLSTHCRNRSVVGILNHDGCFADLLRIPSINCHAVPDSVDDDHAVFTEPLAAAFQVIKQVPVTAKTWVTVLGDGRLGLLCGQVLRNAGAPVRVIGKHADKLALCDKWGIRNRPLAEITPRHDQDVVVDCTGSAAGFELALQMLRPRGTLVLKSTVATGKQTNLAPIVIDEVTIVGSRCGPFREALAALAGKTVDVVSLVHRKLKLDQGVEAMDLAGRPGVMKVLLQC
jgi:threonine dehydrogenase-like Zn-dependent dehydrogenase